jgi:tight adherence protein C
MSADRLLHLLDVYLTVRIGPITLDPVETAILAAAVATLVVSGFNLWRIGGREERQARLVALRTSLSSSGDNAGPVPPPWYRRFGGWIASSPVVGASDRDRLLRLLTAAGIHRQGRLATVVAAKVCGSLTLAGTGWLLAFYGTFGTILLGKLILIFGGFIIGWRLPDIVLSRLAARRRARLEEGMPDALDLLVVCAEAGLSLNQAIDEVSRGLRTSNPTVADEFAATASEMRVQPDVEIVLDNLVNRTGLDSLRGLLATLKQTLRFGTPLAESLRILAGEMRAVRQARMEERAARLPVLLAIPMAAFILPPLLMVVGTPVALRLMDTMSAIFAR